jgi:hypothetical protein
VAVEVLEEEVFPEGASAVEAAAAGSFIKMITHPILKNGISPKINRNEPPIII